MNLYHCMIELKNDAKALTFAGAVETWMPARLETGDVLGWRLLRRKLGLRRPFPGQEHRERIALI